MLGSVRGEGSHRLKKAPTLETDGLDANLDSAIYWLSDHR